MNDPKGTRRRPIQLKFYVNEKESANDRSKELLQQKQEECD